MSVEIVDDKKEKYQSVEAHVDMFFVLNMGDVSGHITGFGATEIEARHNLKLCIGKLIIKLNDSLKELAV